MKHETVTKMFEATLSEGKLYAGRFARLQKQTNEMTETVFGLRVDGDRLRDQMSDQNKGWQSKCDSLNILTSTKMLYKCCKYLILFCE